MDVISYPKVTAQHESTTIGWTKPCLHVTLIQVMQAQWAVLEQLVSSEMLVQHQRYPFNDGGAYLLHSSPSARQNHRQPLTPEARVPSAI